MQRTLDLLRQQHDEIKAAVRNLVALFDRPYEQAAPELTRVRTAIAQSLSRHLRAEDELLLAPLRERRLIATIPGCEAIMTETRELRLAYSEHIGTWTSRAIAERWAEYAVASRKLNQRLIDLCTVKMTTLYPVVLQYIRTTQVIAA